MLESVTIRCSISMGGVDIGVGCLSFQRSERAWVRYVTVLDRALVYVYFLFFYG